MGLPWASPVKGPDKFRTLLGGIENSSGLSTDAGLPKVREKSRFQVVFSGGEAVK